MDGVRGLKAPMLDFCPSTSPVTLLVASFSCIIDIPSLLDHPNSKHTLSSRNTLAYLSSSSPLRPARTSLLHFTGNIPLLEARLS